MDCSRTTNERDSDIGDDSALSHDENSDHDDDLRDCDSGDETGHLNSTTNGNGMDYSIRSPSDHVNPDLTMSHHPQFPPNHALGVLGNFMGVAGLHNMPSLQHGDVLEKLKMQVRDMKVGLMDQDYPSHSTYGSTLPTPPNTAFTLPSTTLNNYNHQPQNLSQPQNQQQTSHSHSNGFPFTPPNAPSTKDGNPGSNSSTSSEASNSSQQNNGWSFEEQFKQVRQLYEINDDPKRKEFLDDLFSFMQKRGTPINRLPIMAKSVLDLYELYNLVIARGGLVDVINKKLWQEIIKGLHLPSSITSAAFTLRTQYMKYLYPYECEKKNLSTPSELQAAIDGNRREGRRSSYGQFEAMHNQLQMPQMQRPPVPNSMQQMSPLALVTHGNPSSAHHRLMAPPLGQMPNIVTHELEQRMMEYLKLFQTQKDPRRSQSPEITPREALNALEMSRVALWSMYHNNTSPPSSVNTSPQCVEPQREALNLSESPPNTATMKRTHDTNNEQSSIMSSSERERDEFSQPPPAKRGMSHDFLVPANHHHHHHHNNNTKNRNNNNNSSSTSISNNNNTSNINKYDDEHDDSLADSSNDLKRMNCDDKDINSQTSTFSHNGLINGEISLLSGMQFKVTRRGNGINGEQQLVVNLELNGVQYEGVLFAMPNSHSQITSLDSPASTSSTSRNGTVTGSVGVVGSGSGSVSGSGGGGGGGVGGGGGGGVIGNEATAATTTTVTSVTPTASVDERTRSIVSS